MYNVMNPVGEGVVDRLPPGKFNKKEIKRIQPNVAPLKAISSVPQQKDVDMTVSHFPRIANTWRTHGEHMFPFLWTTETMMPTANIGM